MNIAHRPSRLDRPSLSSKHCSLSPTPAALTFQKRSTICLFLVWTLICQTIVPNVAGAQSKAAFHPTVKTSGPPQQGWFTQFVRSVMASAFSADATVDRSAANSAFIEATEEIKSFAFGPANSVLFPPSATPSTANGLGVIRHAPSLNGNARVEGSLRQLTGESVSLNGGAVITNDLMVPGTPALVLNGNPIFGGTTQGEGSAQPTNYQVTLNGGTTTLGRLVTRTDPIALANVPAPPASQGTRSLTITSPEQSAGDFATLRDLTLKGNAGMFKVPPGTYRNFVATGDAGFVFGISGASEPAAYNLSDLTLNGKSQIQIVGPVNLTVGASLTLNASMGSATNPAWLNLRVASGGVTLNGGSSLSALVTAPAGTVNINGNAELIGTVACDRLTINGGGLLRLTESALPPVNQPPVVSAGSNQSITLPGSAVLNGSVADDGLPTGSSLTSSWGKVSGPGPVNFDDANNAETAATFSQPGIYVLRLTASDSLLTNKSDVTITVNPQNYPPIVNAGPERTITLPASASLNGSASDDGLPTGSTLSVIWSKTSGPGIATFTNPKAVVTNASFSEAGTYTLRLTASDSQLSTSADVQVVVIPENHTPDANAGADQTLSLPGVASLNGSAGDDGLPAGSTLATTWSKVSGPGTVTFAHPSMTVTTAAFSEAGNYVLRLTATDSELTSSDDIVVIVDPENQAPTVNAGEDQAITLPAHAGLNGSVNDDGWPRNSSITISWSQVSGPGTANFALPNATITTVSFTDPGSYVLRLTASDTQLSVTDEVQVTVVAENHPPTVNAGPDQTIELPTGANLHGSVSDDGLPSGSSLISTWSKVSGLGTVAFANQDVPVTPASFNQPGTYILRLTADDSVLTTSDDVTIVVTDPRMPPVASFVVPESTGTAGALVLASSGSIGSAFAGDKLLDDNIATYWQTQGIVNQFVKLQFFDQQMVFIDRVRIQAANGNVSPAALKDFDVQVSSTTSDDASFVTILSGTVLNNGQLQEFAFPGGPVRSRFIKLLPRTNYGSSGGFMLATFNPVAVGSADSLISLPGQSNIALSQSPAMPSNGGAIYNFSYPGGASSANNLIGYFAGGWQTSNTPGQFATIQLAGAKSYTIEGIRLATWYDGGSAFAFATGVKDFEVWVSNTTPDAISFTKVLTATAPFVPYPSQFLFPGGPVQARYVKYVPLNNGGGGATINTQMFDVIAAGTASVLGVSQESPQYQNSAQAAFDGVTTTYWIASGTVANVWVKTALANGAIHPIYGVRIHPMSDGSFQQGPKDFEVRVSTTTADDSAFSAVYSGTVSPSNVSQEFLFPNLIDARYVQFFWKNGYHSSVLGVRELEVLAAPDRGAGVVSFSNGAGNVGRALDLDPTDQPWITPLNQNTNVSFKLILPRDELTTISHIALRPAIASNGSYKAPKDFEFQVSTTDAADSSFTTAFAGTLVNSAQLQDFYFAPVQARYVRLVLLKGNDFSSFALHNFQVYSSNRIGTTTRFVDQSSDADGQIVSWTWNFGDGATSTVKNPTYTFVQPGDYTVSLSVTDNSGLTSSYSNLFHVVESVKADFALSPIVVHEGGEAVRFTDTQPLLSHPDALRQYDFGDGSPLFYQSAQGTVYTYPDNGVFQVTLKVGEPLGVSHTATREITVLNMPPAVDIVPGKALVWGESWTSVPQITDQSPIDGLTLQGQWNFGDGQTSLCVNCTNANATVAHSYAHPGTYDAVLTLTDKDGGVGSDTATFVVNKRPIAFTFQNPPAQTVGQPLVIHALLKDTFANLPLAGKPVVFTLNGATFNATTDASGVAQVSVPLPAGTRIDIITASFAEDEYYLSGGGVAVPPTAGGTPPSNASSHQGTNFWLMFPYAYTDSAPAVQRLYITSPVATSGTVTVPGLGFTQNFTVAPNAVQTVQLPSGTNVTDNNLVTNKGVHVTSLQPLAVYGLNRRGVTSDAFLGLPVSALGLDHYILTYSNMSFAPSSELGVVAAENGTIVTITPSVTSSGHPGGVPYNVTLNQGQTYLLQNLVPTVESDLSGTRVTANKPIGVFGAHEAATIPAEAVCCADHLVEQLPPTGAWGKRFATVPLATRLKGDFFRFIAAEDGTNVYLNGNLTATLNRGQWAERILTTRTEIIATRPIMVAQYSTSIRYDFGTTGKADPFLMIIPPYSQFLDHYTITTPAGYDINYVNLVAPTASLGSITLDGSPIPAASFAPIGVSGFSGAQLAVSAGAHTLVGPASFGVYVYGYNLDEGYGYPGGMNTTVAVQSTNVAISPEVSSREINTQGCVVATVTDQDQLPLGGKTLKFTVSGANPSNSSVMTDAAGQGTLCYVGTSVGTDQIVAAVGGAQATASIVWTPLNQPPVVNAGANQSITMPAPVNLQGTATDDGLPANTLTVSWSKVSGPGAVTFGNSNVAITTAMFAADGVYVLRLTVSDSALSVSDEVQITVNPVPPNQPPTANAGPDLSTTINGNLIVNGGNDAPLSGTEIPAWTEAPATPWTLGSSSIQGFPEPQRGASYFYSGSVGQAELRQDVDLSAFAATIAFGTQQFEFKAWVRSLAEPFPDTGRVVVEYRDATNTSLIASIDSGDITTNSEWHLTEDTRMAPLGTGWIRVRLIAVRNPNAPSDASNDAFFDSISLRPVGAAAVKLGGEATDDGLPYGSSLSAAWRVLDGPAAATFTSTNAAISGVSFTTPGTYVLRLTSSDGQATASDDVTVVVNPINQPPVVNAGTDQTITLPATASLSGTVTDDGQPPGGGVSVSWSKLSGPGAVTFVNVNQPNTTASFTAAGTYLLRLTADDTEYSTVADVTITVNPEPVQVNHPPAVNPGSNQTISLPTDTVTLNGTATDDGLPAGSTLTINWTQISGPGVVTFGNASTAVTTAQFSGIGSYVLRLSASDGTYLASAEVGVIVTPQNHAPTANAGADQTILLSQGAQLNGSVSDDGWPSGNLTTTWTRVTGPGSVTFMNPKVTITGAQFSAAGTYVLRLTASDTSLSAYDELTITVDDNVAPPMVEITSPAEGRELTEPTPVTGSVSNANWVLEYSLNSEDGGANQLWTEAASGTGPVTNGSLGALDTTLMLNGIYSLRLRATDNYGQSSITSIAVLVDKNFKVGQFQIAFSDLNVPVAGLPIEVIRSYDTRDKRVGDFGVGWQLGIKSARVEKTGVLGFGWHQTVTSGFIPNYCLEPSRPHKVAITFGDGKVFKFRASTTIHCQQFIPIAATQLTFTAEPGTHATLESTTATDVIVELQGGIPGPVRLINQSNPDIYNTGSFRLTTAEGTVYVIDQRHGVSSVRDAYGNTVTVGAAGIVHSSGQSIAFTRDGAGRITQITDPNGNPQTYRYNANGDLVSYIDREQNPTTFTYNSSHQLLSITDARGIELLRNQYDPGSRRMIGQTDAFNESLVYDHDITGRVETITDRLGHPTRFEYDERGNILRQVDARGGIKTFTYDAFDNVLTETNALNHTTTYTYDAADNRTSIKDAEDNITRFTYNNARQPLTVTDARNNVTINTYDASGTNLLTTKDPLDNPTSFTYSVLTGQRTTMTDALDQITRYGYDSANRLNSETDALGNITSYGYDANGNRTTQTVTRTSALGQPESIVTVYTYDKLNRLTKTTFADGSFTRIEYNAIGQQAATIDQLGRRTEFTYDDMGRLTRTDYPDVTHEDVAYDAEGRRIKSRDRAGRFTSFTYDELGRLTKTTYPDGTFTSTTYDAAGQVLTTTDARRNVTRYFYDDAGRRTKVKNALNQDTLFAFDANGNQISMTDALLHTTHYEYDENNRRTKTTYHDGSFETVGHDDVGRSVSKTDQSNKTTWFTYDDVGRLIKVKDALGQETIYGYDELGQQLTQTDANNHTTRFAYDQLGRRVKRMLPGGQFETYAYDTAGNLRHRTDFNGKTTTFNYDVMRRLLSRVPDASLNQPTISFTYNNIGQRATMSDASGTTIYNYDGRNRLSSKQTPFGTLSYTYDDASNLSTARSSNANGTSVDYTYDELNRLATVKDNRLGAVNGGSTSYNYDEVGNLRGYLYPNGVTTTYNYNSLNRLTSMNASTPLSTLASYTYALGGAGNRTAVTELSGRTVNYTYDDLYRLTNETISGDTNGINGMVGYGYDPVGNRLNRTSSLAGVPSQSSTYDANDRLTSDTYDANGNTKVSTGGTYEYDFEDRLASLITHDSSLITFVYDGEGNRVARTVNGVTTNYLVDTNNHTGYAQVFEELQAGAVVKQFTYGHDLISQRCTLPTANCSLSFYGYDGHGSVRFLTDSAAATTDTYSYDAFGNLISRTGTTSNDYLYSGEQFDANLGFYYLRARYMNPSSGRFWSMDAYEGGTYDPGSLHKYLYTGNNPTNLTDPSGHYSLVDTVNTSVLIGTVSGFAMGLLSGGLEGAVKGAIQGAIMGTLVPLTGAGVGSFLLGNAARGVFITGWGVGLGSAGVSGYSVGTATSGEERIEAGIGLVASMGFMYFGPKLLQRANTRIISADGANAEFLSARRGQGQPPWEAGTNVTETTIFQSAKYVRVYAQGQTKPVGSWVMAASEIEGLNATQIKQKFALPFAPTHVVPANLPAGTTLRIGMAGQNSFGPGGGLQVNIREP